MSETHALTTTRPLEATMDQPLTVEHIAHNCAGDRNLHIFQLEDHCRLLATRLAACQQERDTFKNLAGPHTVAWYGENLQASVQEQLRDSRSALDEHMQNYAELHNERDALTVELATKENGLMGLCHQNAALFIEVHDLKASNARLRVVGDEILEIMTVYHEQAKSSYGVDTPGGLEHMGDVWGLFLKWEDALSA